MKIQRGEIYLADFGFAHLKIKKHRPVLVLQCNEDNQNTYFPFVIIAPVTTKKTDKIYKQDVYLPKKESNLKKDSKVILGAVTTVMKQSLKKRLGHVSKSVMNEVDLKLLRLMGLLNFDGK